MLGKTETTTRHVVPSNDKDRVKDEKLPASRATVVGEFGDWQVQLVRVEFVSFLRERETSRMPLGMGQERVFFNVIYGMKGNSPSENLLVCLRRVCLKDTKVAPQGPFVGGIPTFTVVGKARPLPLRAMGPTTLKESQTEIELLPASGLLGFAGKGEYTKGQQLDLVAVLEINKGDADSISRDGIRIQVEDYVPGQKVELPLSIPGKQN
jgi:hypothetical protein